jgi:CRISPR-associated protein Cmr1
MFQRETAIWGGISGSGPTASRVSVRVDQVTGLQIEPAFVYRQDPTGRYRTMPDPAAWIEPYALFPARGELTADKRAVAVAPHAPARAGMKFRLRLCLDAKLSDAQIEEIDTALRWWASFGGVGARTRRGLGAVQVTALKPVSAAEVSAQGGRLVLRPGEPSSEYAWKKGNARLRDFRQGVGLGRNTPSAGTKSPAGRSLWPEPDAIRRLTGDHAPPHAPTHPVKTALPRAAFGLPIVFHFKDEQQGDPAQQLLVPEGSDRWASQLVLRPYWDGQQWRPAALLLPGWEAVLNARVGFAAGPAGTVWPTDPDERQRLATQIRPMKERGTDPLSAFMAYFQEA